MAGRVREDLRAIKRRADERRLARRSLLAKTGCSVRQNRVILTPQRLASSLRRFCEPNRADKTIFAGDGVKQARSPGRARYKPLKPLRGEGRIASAEPVCSCAFSYVRLARETAGAARTRSS